jgi:hypothetical protein
MRSDAKNPPVYAMLEEHAMKEIISMALFYET